MEQYWTMRDFFQNRGMGMLYSEAGEINRELDKKLKKCMSNMLRFLYEVEGVYTIRQSLTSAQITCSD